jgi:hypothetical protein
MLITDKENDLTRAQLFLQNNCASPNSFSFLRRRWQPAASKFFSLVSFCRRRMTDKVNFHLLSFCRRMTDKVISIFKRNYIIYHLIRHQVAENIWEFISKSRHLMPPSPQEEKEFCAVSVPLCALRVSVLKKHIILT